MSLDSALKLSILYIIEGGGVNILYHNILTPPHPIKKKCKVKYLIACRWVCYCLSLLNNENILDVNNRVYNITQKSVDWCGLLFIRMTLLRINIQDHNG